ncbi:MAG: PilZ domain-containing protein [Deltaproteobacteria bacterium]
MAEPERRSTERLSLRIPIHVIGFGTADGDFTEDTETLVVNQAGARIALKHHVAADDTIRIMNADTHAEAEFRVVGPTRMKGEEVSEWGVECTEKDHDVWGLQIPAPMARDGKEAGALLECRACKSQGFWPLTLMEIEVLDSTGEINRLCNKCAKTTYWTYADINRRPRQFSPDEPVAPKPREAEIKRFTEKRKFKRMLLMMPIYVKNQKGEVEISKTDNISKGGCAVPLAMELQVGDIVSVECPHTSEIPDILQKAEVRYRAKFSFSDRRVYGLKYIR